MENRRTEPTLDELLSDTITRLLMWRDGVEAEAVRCLLRKNPFGAAASTVEDGRLRVRG